MDSPPVFSSPPTRWWTAGASRCWALADPGRLPRATWSGCSSWYRSDAARAGSRRCSACSGRPRCWWLRSARSLRAGALRHAGGPASHVAPAREVSMLFAALIGGHLLAEGDRVLRVLGAGCIAAGSWRSRWAEGSIRVGGRNAVSHHFAGHSTKEEGACKSTNRPLRASLTDFDIASAAYPQSCGCPRRQGAQTSPASGGGNRRKEARIVKKITCHLTGFDTRIFAASIELIPHIVLLCP